MEGFWERTSAKELDWQKKWDKVLEDNFDKARVKWFVGGKLNVAYNCLDRHSKRERKGKTAIIWESETGESKTYTYEELHREVCKLPAF